MLFCSLIISSEDSPKLDMSTYDVFIKLPQPHQFACTGECLRKRQGREQYEHNAPNQFADPTSRKRGGRTLSSPEIGEMV
jgi:hypothetical protein